MEKSAPDLRPRSSAPLRWNLSTFLKDGKTAEQVTERLGAQIAALAADTAERTRPLAALLLTCEKLEAEREHLDMYVDCLRALDQHDARLARLALGSMSLEAEISKIWGHLRRQLAEFRDKEFEALLAHPDLAGARFRLQQERREGQSGLSPGEQALAADLLVDSLYGWSRLAEQVLGDLTFTVEPPDGRKERAAFARRFDYFWGPDPDIRAAAWAGLQTALSEQATVLAACLNGLMGSRLTLLDRRGRTPAADAAERNGLDPQTIDTMLGVLRAEAGTLHRYIDQKSVLLGLPRLGMQDRSAPPPGRAFGALPGDAIVQRVRNAVARVSPGFAASVDRMRAAGWIDAGTEPNRQAGACCFFSPLSGEPRIFLNVDGSFYSQTVFAHELGHAYHDEILGRLRPFRNRVPSSLAETASITGEHLFRAGMLRDPGTTPGQRIEILVAELDTAVNYLLRLPRDYEFERAAYQARRDNALSPETLCALQSEAHRDWFGDQLGADPYAWAGQPLLYSRHTDFFNISYTFGFLLSSAIAAEFERQGPRFEDAYEAFLAETGSRSAEDAAAVMGFDLRAPEFWRAALGRVDHRVAELTRCLAISPGRQ
jgi:oligoendopeptidase F